ncbi:metal-dependent transcriptional regulator [Moheibacter sediminis]|uniref:Transcriptional regulator MntR n=1 Tax=Moheibacter sediminis TaxID=1434700 RepID=A0A1W2B512_9FLAO|nr:metal-dependent transcriptional regulator [Moheibacter sediminis]SMC68077.1 iron (metal) dependent repressor, DtxR family [Moheibacter sediminis]
MNSFTEENYLKAMFNLSEKSGEITVNDLSKSLNIKMPTVNSMVKRLSAKGYINYQSYKPITLTEEGRMTALLIIRKHRLTEMFLVEKMGFGWEEVHEVAEQIEHIHSPKFFAKMDEMLDFPTVDPHGSPIPDNSGNIQLKNYNPLSFFGKNDLVKLVAVTHSNEEFLKFLNSKNLQLDTIIEVLHKEEFDQTMTVKFYNQEITLSEKVTEKLLVEKQ